MWSFIANNPDAVAALAAVVGGYLFKGKKDADFGKLKDQLLAKLRRELLDLLAEYASVDKARTALTWAADALLNELKVKRNALIDTAVEALIEQALKEYAEKLGTVVLKARIDELFGAVSNLPEAFKAGADKLEASEAAFRAASNVEVVTEMPK